ncbi:Serine/threonine-protein phosphatase 6 regulatory ankyrin repeat subunit B [Pelomyxa schiedti]|nr:Serine/threonine-protein phosphatase 6 regulatory ankyrin repeat subunit B [Pelomyxa schiedti]
MDSGSGAGDDEDEASHSNTSAPASQSNPNSDEAAAATANNDGSAAAANPVDPEPQCEGDREPEWEGEREGEGEGDGDGEHEEQDEEKEEVMRGLIVAARYGRLEEVKDLVERRGADVNCRAEDDWTPLHVACQRMHLDVILYLLSKGADTSLETTNGEKPHDFLFDSSAPDLNLFMQLFKASCSRMRYSRKKDGATPLHIACEQNNIDLMKELLSAGFDVTQKCRNGSNAFHTAVDSGNIHIVTLMLSCFSPTQLNTIAVSQRGLDNCTPFMIACIKSQLCMGELMCEKFSNDHFRLVSCNSSTLLHFACSSGASDQEALWWVKKSVEGGCDVNTTRTDGCTALHLAIQESMKQVSTFLVESGAVANIRRNDDGDTALHTSLKKCPDLVWLLLNRCKALDLTAKSNDGSTCLLLACEQGDMALIHHLLSANASVVNTPKNDGTTPLHIATSRGHREMALLLLEYGADVNSSIATGETLMHLVLGPSSESLLNRRWSRRPEWAMMFLSKSQPPMVNVNAKRNDGTTLLILACHFADVPVVNRLLELGADPSSMKDDGTCPLLIAFDKNHQEKLFHKIPNLTLLQILAKILITAGARTMIPSRRRGGQSPLMTAIQRNDHEWVRLLYSCFLAADAGFISDDGSTVLHMCSDGYPDDEVFDHILNQVPDVNAARGDGCTALHLVAQRGNTARTKALIKKGANVHAKAHHRLTPLHFACRGGHSAVSKLLLSAGANPDSVAEALSVDDSEGTPMSFAREAGNFRLVRMLMDPLRSSLAVMLRNFTLDSDDDASHTKTPVEDVFEPMPQKHVGVCSICDQESVPLVVLSRCHHEFCAECLNGWFTSSFNGYTHSRCPNKGCQMIVSYYDLRECVANINQYEEQMLRRAIMDIPDFRWCPKCQTGGITSCCDAICFNCGFHYCAQCMFAKHEGTCESYFQNVLEEERGKRRESRKAKEMFESEKWIKDFSKPCPGCKCNIKRSGGCSHIVCKNCQFQWCWLCGGTYMGLYTFGDKCPCNRH